MIGVYLRATTLAILAFSGVAQANCRQALALGMDVSGSVDAVEYRLQLDGLASALLNTEVQNAFLVHPKVSVRFMVYEWSGLQDQRVIIPWQTIDGIDDLIQISTRLNATHKAHSKDETTALAAAMLFGAQQLNQHQDCWQRTLDISGDGPANIGAHPKAMTDDILGGITINGLVVSPSTRSNTTKNLTNVKTLLTYYRSFVLRGSNAFTETAETHRDFSEAMRRKLIRELQLPNLSMLDQPQWPGSNPPQ